MNENSIKCVECGAERPRSNRRAAASAAAKKTSADANRASADVSSSAKSSAEKQREARPQGGGSRPSAEGMQFQRPREVLSRDMHENVQTPAEMPPKRIGSMPPSVSKQPTAPQAAPRMVKRHSYEAITPQTQGYDHVNWLRMCVIAVICVVVLVGGIYFFLSKTSPGQRWLASNEYEASAEAYHEIGRTLMTEGSISKAIKALEIAQAKEPNNLEILVDLGKAYLGVNNLQDAELAFGHAIQKWPEYPEPYRFLSESLIEQGRTYEAMQLLEMAMEKNEDSYFETTFTRLLPATPSIVDPKEGTQILGGRFGSEFSIKLISEEDDVEIYYTLNGKDPKEVGILYKRPIYLEEGGRKLRAVAKKGDVFSKEMVQSFVINKPTPDMPRSNLLSGTYKSVRTVSLRAENDAEIYYTTDGTTPIVQDGEVINGILYENPIQLRIGKTEIRAFAKNSDGKFSNVLSIEYKCEGKTKTSMEAADTIGGLKLYGTTRSTFESKYGAPLSEHPDGEDMMGVYTKLIYSFGYAIFLDRGNESEPFLMELSTSSTAFSGPRGTGIGSRMQDVIDAYRDEGGENNAKGGRLLYSLTGQNMRRIGMMDKLSETEYQVAYYCMLENGQFISLIYHITDGLVDRMDWVQYDVAK